MFFEELLHVRHHRRVLCYEEERVDVKCFSPPKATLLTFADQSSATIKTIAAARRCSAFMHQR